MIILQIWNSASLGPSFYIIESVDSISRDRFIIASPETFPAHLVARFIVRHLVAMCTCSHPCAPCATPTLNHRYFYTQTYPFLSTCIASHRWQGRLPLPWWLIGHLPLAHACGVINSQHLHAATCYNSCECGVDKLAIPLILHRHDTPTSGS